ncbi:MAG: ABC transporter substrate-binding protein [Deltaproteobacteria bacterium]|nr:ABC transporter substrate-binding protein [Deltaproteobacteria bacterium]
MPKKTRPSLLRSACNGLFFVFCALLFYLSSLSVSPAAQISRVKLLVGYSSPSGSQAVLWVAKESGAFSRHGIDVELIFVGSGSKMTQAVLAGELKIAQLGGVAPIAARLGGADAKIIAVSFNTLANSLIVNREIQSVHDLKGKRVGVSRFGTNTDAGARYVIKKNGLVPDRDVAILQLGDIPAVFAALQTGAVQGGILSYPTTARALKMGFKELVDISEIGLEYPGTNIVTMDRFLRSQPDLVRGFLMAFIEGIHRYKSDAAFTKRVIGQYARITDAGILDDTYRLFAQKLQKIPYPTPGGIRFALETLIDNPKARQARPEEFYDDTILRALEREGLVEQLYR